MKKVIFLFVFILVSVLLLFNSQCKKSSESDTPTNYLDYLKTLVVTSNSFNNGEHIPLKYSCYGENISPHLKWNNIPESALSFAVFMIDASAGFIHMILYNIPQNISSLPEDIMSNVPEGAAFVTNNLGFRSYFGPCPDNTCNEYHFEVYAYDLPVIDLSSVQSRSDLIALTRDHILAWGELVGKFAAPTNR